MPRVTNPGAGRRTAALRVVLVSFGLLAPGLAAAGGEPSLVERGQTVYQDYCAVCHGSEGQGLTADWRQRNSQGELPPPPHDDSGHTWRHSDAMLFKMIHEGWRDPFNKTDRLTMPAFGETLEVEQIEAVIAYLKTLWKEEHQAYQERESEKR